MGQFLNNPPSVEGWHQGTDWLDSGTLVERINFASQQIGDTDKPGIQAMIGRISDGLSETTSPERLVDACLDEVGALAVDESTRRTLVDFSAQGSTGANTDRQHIADVLPDGGGNPGVPEVVKGSILRRQGKSGRDSPVTTQGVKPRQASTQAEPDTVLVPPLGPIVLRLDSIVELTDDVLLE